jgi:5-methylthioribose kinase
VSGGIGIFFANFFFGFQTNSLFEREEDQSEESRNEALALYEQVKTATAKGQSRVWQNQLKDRVTTILENHPVSVLL